ncbi:MAG: hypothetical protein AB7S26_01825 [Sandaracinaceae bacterium]
MTLPTRFSPDDIFAVLARHGVQFVLIGGLAGGARGAGWPTFDADIVVNESEENLGRLLAALDELDAVYDTLHQPPIVPDLKLVRGSHGPQLFRTRGGRLDVLKEAGGETFASLIVDSTELEVHGSRMQCASLAALLRMKRAANRRKDQPAIELIEAKLAELEPTTSGGGVANAADLDPRLLAIHRVLIGLRFGALTEGMGMEEVAAVADALELAVIDVALSRDFDVAWRCLAHLERLSPRYQLPSPPPPTPDAPLAARARAAIEWWASAERSSDEVHPDFRWFVGPALVEGLRRDDPLLRAFGSHEVQHITHVSTGGPVALVELITVEAVTGLRYRNHLLMRFADGLLIELRTMASETLES